MDNIKSVCKILLLAIIALTIWQMVAFLIRKQSMIEPSGDAVAPVNPTTNPTNPTETHNPTPDIAPPTDRNISPNHPSTPLDFYVRGDRFSTCHQGSDVGYTLPAPDPHECGPKFDWRVWHEPGANNTQSDLLWHQMEPRMILQDIGMQCHDCGFNSPKGVASEYTSQLTGNM